ncbi:MAG: response regulator [Chloroflexota bacterium]
MTDLNIQISEDSLRDCLAHLYDYNFLQEHPFVRLVVPHIQGNTSRIQVFQQVILDAIERLKPRDPANPNTKNSRLYDILHLRYRQQQQVQSVLKQLNLGERQFYRDHTKAVQALAHLLEEHLTEGASLSANVFSIHAELDRVQRQNTPVNNNVDDFLSKTLTAIKSLSERQQSELFVQHSAAELPGSLDQTLLRQVIIWIVTQLVSQSPSGSHFVISFEIGVDTAKFTFARDFVNVSVVAPHFINDHQETLGTLLNALGGSISERVDNEQNVTIFLEIPVKQHSVLIIDDNPDAITLFRQFLTGQPHQLFTAYEGTQAIELAHEIHPELIILDVLLPNQDGWEILQQLKNHPSTMDTPVFICSVLDAKDLAILLGADGFLHKPPEEYEFFDALKRFSH